MEDWGLISYAEGLLLFDPARSSPRPATHRLRRRGARDRAPVVRQPRHRTRRGRRSGSTRRSRPGSRTRSPTRSTRSGRSALHRALPSSSRAMQRDAGTATRAIRSGPGERARGLRRARLGHLREGRRGALDARAVDRAGDVPARARELHARARCRTRRRATLASHRPGVGPRRRRGGGELDRQAGLSARSACSTRCVAGQTIARLSQKRFVLGGEADNAALWQVPLALANDEGAHQSLLSRADGGGHAAGLRTAGRECRRPRLLPCRLRPGPAPRTDAPLHRPCAGRPRRAAQRPLRAPAGRTGSDRGVLRAARPVAAHPGRQSRTAVLLGARCAGLPRQGLRRHAGAGPGSRRRSRV